MRGHLGARELGAVALLLILGRLAWIEPTMLVDNPGPSAYLVPLLAFPLGMLALWFAVRAVRTTGDPIAPARIVCEFAKKNKDVISIKGGFVEGKVLSVDELKAFGELPSKDALVAQVLGTFLAPITSLAVVLDQICQAKGGASAEA